MTIIDQVRSIAEWSKQTRAIAAHLEKYGAIYKKECTHGGIPGYGVIEHPGARIFDLREAGWQIRTETRPTRWVLRTLRNEGAITIGAIARSLNDRKIPTPRGSRWHVSAVANLLARAQKLEGVR